MDTNNAKELQRRIAEEAISLASLFGEAAEVRQHEQAVTLIGKAWRLPEETTGEQLTRIRQEKEAMSNKEELEFCEDAIKETDIVCNWSGMETLEALEDLFETSLHLDSYTERKALFDMAAQLMECQNFLDWIEKTPAEKGVCEPVAV